MFEKGGFCSFRGAGRREKTGVQFENKVVQNGENNVLNYPYYFNGGGVAVGDINNDGLQTFTFQEISLKISSI
jgi:hypothetical protein